MNATLVKSEVTRSEALRLETLEKYEILGAAPDPAIDDLAELAARTCNAPAAGISFASADRIWLPSRIGIQEAELPLGSLPGLPPRRTRNSYEIPDTRHHPSFAPGGIFLACRAFRFYAGN